MCLTESRVSWNLSLRVWQSLVGRVLAGLRFCGKLCRVWAESEQLSSSSSSSSRSSAMFLASGHHGESNRRALLFTIGTDHYARFVLEPIQRLKISRFFWRMFCMSASGIPFFGSQCTCRCFPNVSSIQCSTLLKVFEFKYSGFEAWKHPLTHTLFRSQLFLKVSEFKYNGFEARNTHSDPHGFQISICWRVFEFKYSGFEAHKTHSDPHACFSDLN